MKRLGQGVFPESVRMKLFLRLAAIAAITVLLALMLGPSSGLEGSIPHLDKAAHVVAFFIIAASLRVLFTGWRYWMVCAVALGVGAGVEVVQGMIGRDASWGDLLADLVGVLLAYFARPVLHAIRVRLLGED